MAAVAEAPSRNGNGPKLDLDRYRNAVKATMKKRDPAVGTRIDPTDEEVDRFLMEAALYGLEPLVGQIYASWDDGVMKAVTTIDGLRALAERTKRYDGQSDPEWCDREGKWTDYWGGEEAPVAARVRVQKKGTKVPTTGTANWHDFAPQGNVGADSLWNLTGGKPAHMLSIRAEALALRKAFPAELSGLYTAEELGISLAAIGAGQGETAGSSVAIDIPPAPSSPPPGGGAAPPASAPPVDPTAEQVPAVIVGDIGVRPSGPPARPRVKRTLAEALGSGEYQRLRGDLTEALFDQGPNSLTEEQRGILSAALIEAEEAGITPVELERLCKVALTEGKGRVEVRSRALLEWISQRRQKVDLDGPLDVDGQAGSEAAPGERPSGAEPSGPPSLLDGDPGPEPRD